MASLTYTSISEFKNDVPEKHQGILSNDTDGAYDPNSSIVENALIWGEQMFESKVSVRDDYELPVLDHNDETPPTVEGVIHDLALWKLYKRRSVIPDDIREIFNVAMQWLDDVSKRRANINVDQDGDDEPEDNTTETPLVGGNKAEFDNFTF